VERLSQSPSAYLHAAVPKRGHRCASLLAYWRPGARRRPLRPRPALTGEIVNDVLVLNFTYEALNITSFQRAVKLLFSGKAEIVHRRDEIIKSTSYQMKLPSIIRMLYYIKRPMQKVALTKKNVLLRDDYTCQYCNLKGERMMTVDHVLPKSKGGPSTWENLVCACMRCNNRKNNRTPEHANMKLKRKPKAPKYIPWIRVKRNTLPGEWHQFLFLYNVSIEEKIEG
jgi:5-methylcytosine-specific restriction endonuclease McrA